MKATAGNHGGGTVRSRPRGAGWHGLAFWRTLGLRGRTTLVMTALALLLAVTLGVTVWVSVSGYLISKRTESSLAQAATNAEQVNQGLTSPGLSTPQLLAQLPRTIGSASLLRVDGRWYTTSLETDRRILPAELIAGVLAGSSMHQRLSTDRGPQLVVGLPLQGGDRAYFEVFPLTELDQTLRTLSTVLWLVMVTVPVVALLLGRWALQPAFRPLDRVAAAAAAIASGNLAARIDARGDPGLDLIATSFNDTAAALQRRVRADAKFAADVSHELRSPLTTMLNAVDLFEVHRRYLPPQGRETLDLLRAEVQRFERLVVDLLEISRADAGSADVVLEPVLLPDFVTATVPARMQDRVAIEASAQVVVRIDKRRLERVVTNLIDNAERHGGGLTAVVVSGSDQAGCISVEDHGPGVQQRERERIFDRFARGRRTGRDSADGAGLGLSLVARHVDLMHGHVEVSDVAGGGSRFTVTLPREEEPTCAG